MKKQFTITDENRNGAARVIAEWLPLGKWEIEAKRLVRTSQQNKALHKFCTMIAEALCEKGIPFKYEIAGREFEVEPTMKITKDYMWRPMMQAILGKHTTTKLTTSEIDKVATPLLDFLAKEHEIFLSFPSNE